jgi:hypothetical protein
MFDIYGVSTLAKAAEKSIITKLDANEMQEVAESASKLYSDNDYIISPCRFAENGWKYLKKDQNNSYLNHPNKVNSIGYGSPSISRLN